MDERKTDHLKLAPPSLTAALRRARAESAEQSEAVEDLRQAELMRLELLLEAIRPVVAQAPEGVDLFDPGITHGERPRLFLDMIGFVDLGHDRRTYRFFQDTRHGRVLIAETANVDRIVAAMTNYVARRLVEREKALAADRLGPTPKRDAAVSAPTTTTKRTSGAVFAEAFGFVLMMLGAFTLFVALALAGLLVWSNWGRAVWVARFGSAPF